MATMSRTNNSLNVKAIGRLSIVALLVTVIGLYLGPKTDEALENFSIPFLPDKRNPSRQIEQEITHSNTYNTSRNGVTLVEEITEEQTTLTIEDATNHVKREVTQTQFTQLQRDLNATDADAKETVTGELNLSSTEMDAFTSIGFQPIKCTITNNDGEVEEVTLTFRDNYAPDNSWNIELAHGEPVFARLESSETTLTMDLGVVGLENLGLRSCIEG